MIKSYAIFMSVSVAILSGCVTVDEKTDTQSMYVTASALTKLSASVESNVRYKNPPADISDADLLVLATRHDPSLLEPFSGYQLKVLREDHHASVLVCSADGARALLEDVGCTAEMDKHAWQSKAYACVFTLSPKDLCAAH